MTIDEQQPDKQEEYVSPNVRAWKERLEQLRSMSDEEKEEYLERMFAEGRRRAHLMLKQEGVPDMTREEVRDMFAKKYPGLTLSDQIIEDRKMWYERQAPHTAQAVASTKDKPMTIEERQTDKQEQSAQNEIASEWEDPIERLRRMSDEDKAEYLERMFAEGRRRAHLMLGHYGPSTLSREEVRDLLAKKYPGLTLSDQIIEDRKMWYERQASHTAQAIASTEDKPMTIEKQQPDKQEPAAQNETASEWEDPIERLRRMSDEDKAEYLERLFAEGRRHARLMLRQEGEPAIPREKLRDALAKKYPGLTLSDQIIEDRRAGL